jgi:uncharacterized protein (DUF1800 family)
MRLIHPKTWFTLGACSYLVLLPFSTWAGAPTYPSASATTPQRALSAEAQITHVLNRLAYGPQPGEIEAVRRMGVNRFIQSQLHPENIPEDPTLTQSLSQLEAINTPPIQLFMRYGLPLKNADGQKPSTPEEKRELGKKRRENFNLMLSQAAQARLTRALHSNRQLQEVMTEFWYNHFNVFGSKGLDAIWIGNYEETAIRPHALGRFRDLLEATSHHPAMQFYLDNWQNSAPSNTTPPKQANGKGKTKGLNENYARELMELHTLGVDGGYTQQDVIALAHILTGWGIPPARLIAFAQAGNNGETNNAAPLGLRMQALQQKAQAQLNGNGFFFDAKRHDFADKQFLGYTIKGSGEAEGEQALDILARHPATAKFISTELAQYFVNDNPSPALVSRLSQRFIQTDGDIRAVLETLFQSPEFWDPSNVGHKYKTPYRYVVSSVRATNIPIENVRPLTFTLKQQGMPLYGCETPNGYKYTQDAWLSPDGMTQRINFAMAISQNQLKMKQNQNNNGTSDAPTLNAETLADTLIPTLGLSLSENTQAAILEAPPALKPSLILSSPEFMNY